MARNIALFHHERYLGGGGYWGVPLSILPAYISIVQICDIYTALLSERVYKKAWEQEDALRYIEEHTGILFAPALVKLFIPLIRNDSRAAAIFEGEGGDNL